jgi:hypothetical protein
MAARIARARWSLTQLAELLGQRYRAAMPYVVLCGPFQGPPDSIVGPFESIEDAHEYAQTQAGDPEQRFAAVMLLVAPDST